MPTSTRTPAGLCLLVSILFLLPLAAHTRPLAALATGDIAVIGYNIDEPTADGGVTSPNFCVTIVVLADIQPGQVIRITDRGWRTSTPPFSPAPATSHRATTPPVPGST